MFFAVTASCGAAWQLMLYVHLPQPLFTIIFAASGLAFLTIGVAIDLSLSRKLEIFLVVVGLIMSAVSYIGRFQDASSKSQNETVTLGLWMGSLLATAPSLFAVFYHWASASEFSFYDEITLISICIFLLATGVVWQVRASTLLGGGTLAVYLIVLIISLIYQPQVAIGIYLAGGGGMLFLIGLLLAVYRDRLVTLPERIAEQKGVFRVIGWR